MFKKENNKKSFKNGTKKKHGFLFYFLNIFVWTLIAGVFTYGTIRFADKSKDYTLLNTHTAVVISDSMSYVNESNYSYLDKDVEHIEKGDIIKAKEYSTFEEVEKLDVVIYKADDTLVCHRVVDTYVSDGVNWVVTRGDTNAVNDTPVSFDHVRGKVVNNFKKVGFAVMFMQSLYFLIALCGSAFFIFLGILLTNVFSDKKKKGAKKVPNFQKKKEESNEKSPENTAKKAQSNANAPKRDGSGKFVKKTTKSILPLLFLSGASIIAFGSLAESSAFVVQNANDVSFNIGASTPETKYYLVGSFNSWTESETYCLENVTSTMSSETNKIAEYRISGLTLEGGATVKIKSSTGDWLNSFTDDWSDGKQFDENGNYKILMSSNSYSFTLKLYNDKGTSIKVNANKDMMYLKPNSDWKKEGAKFAAYFYKSNGAETYWKYLDQCSDNNYYSVNVPNEYDKIIFVRLNPLGGLNWESKWNQTSDLDIDNSNLKNCAEINGWDYAQSWSYR